jgi:hypothetical protein
MTDIVEAVAVETEVMAVGAVAENMVNGINETQ